MGAFSLHVFTLACGRATTECMERSALFSFALDFSNDFSSASAGERDDC